MSKLQFSQISQTFPPVNFWEFVLLFSVDAWIFQNLLGTLSFSLCKYSLILDHFKEFIACHRVCLILKGKSILFWLMVVRNWISQATRKVPWRRLPCCKMPQSTFLRAGVFLSDCQSFPFWPDVFLVCMSARVSFFSDYQCFYYIPFFLAVFYSDIWRISCLWHIPLWLFFFKFRRLLRYFFLWGWKFYLDPGIFYQAVEGFYSDLYLRPIWLCPLNTCFCEAFPLKESIRIGLKACRYFRFLKEVLAGRMALDFWQVIKFIGS